MGDRTSTDRDVELVALIPAANRLGVPLSAGDAARLLTLLDLLADWNTRLNLTAIRAREDMVQKHLLDSLSVHRYLAGPVVFDVGTGAGFPGLPLAIVNPELRFVLIDSTAKKLAFVRHAAAALNLGNVEIVHSRAEGYEPRARASTVVARAVGAVPLIVAQAGHLCARNGRLLLMKGRYPTEELAEVPSGWRVSRVERLAVPGLDQERHLAILEREP